MLEKRGAGFVVALIFCVATLWSGTAPTSATGEILKSVNSFSYESNSEGMVRVQVEAIRTERSPDGVIGR
jgi:hypothetical protein